MNQSDLPLYRPISAMRHFRLGNKRGCLLVRSIIRDTPSAMKGDSKNNKLSRSSQKMPSQGSPSSSSSSSKSQGSKGQAAGSTKEIVMIVQGLNNQAPNDPIGPTQDPDLIAPGQIARNDAAPPPPLLIDTELSKVTHTLVYDLIQVVESKLVHLAINEEKLSKFELWILDHSKIPAEYCVTRKLPGLAPGCKFSATARIEIEAMAKAQDMAYIKLLRDDMENVVIPECESDVEEAEASARKKLDSKVPAVELHKARRRFEETLESKRESRKGILENRRKPSTKKKNQHQHHQQPKKRARFSQPHHAPPPQWGWGPPPQQQQWWPKQRDQSFRPAWKPSKARKQ